MAVKNPKKEAPVDLIEHVAPNESQEQAQPLDKKAQKLMEKQEKKARRQREKGRKGKLLPVLLALLLVGGIGAGLFFDVFGIRSRYVVPTIQKLPIVGNLVKTEAPASPDDPYANASVGELKNTINTLQQQVDALTTENQSMQDRVKLYTDELTRLQELEAQQVQFKDDKAKFDQMIAENNPAAYASFYEQISPENAETLYKEAVSTAQQSKDFKKYMNTIQAMDATQGAKVLGELARTDMNLVVLILNSLDSASSGGILAAMDPVMAASVVKQMAPPQP